MARSPGLVRASRRLATPSTPRSHSAAGKSQVARRLRTGPTRAEHLREGVCLPSAPLQPDTPLAASGNDQEEGALSIVLLTARGR